MMSDESELKPAAAAAPEATGTVANSTPVTGSEAHGSVRDGLDGLESLKELKQLLEASEAKVAEHWDLFLRTRAEGDNIRRRAAIDVEEARKYGIEKLAKALLSVVDSLEQGIQLSTDLTSMDSTVQALREGSVLTHKLLMSVLESFGLQSVDPQGALFDPSKHEALSMQTDDSVPANTIISVVQKGFMLHDRALRPARVIVARPSVRNAS